MKNEDIVKNAVRGLKESLEADRDNREEAMNDLENLAGLQWDEAIAKQRETDGKPVITVNRLPQFVRQVTDDIRNMNPAIKVVQGDQEATEEIAEIFDGLIRQIQYASNASTVFERAAERAAQCGMGYWRILTQYEGPNSFNQEIKIEAINNPFSVYLDPRAKNTCREDAGFALITEQIDRDDFEKMYPGKSLEDVDFDGNTDGLEYWREGDEVVVAEYFWKEPFKREIVLLEDGSTLDKDKAIGPLRIVAERKVDDHKVMWAKVSGKDVLEGPTEFPCRYIPIVAILGEEIPVGQQTIRTSVIRFAKDSQRLYNYFSSAQAEIVTLQPKAPFLITAKQVAGFEATWKLANTKNYPYLPYNPDEKAPPPQRLAMPVSSQGVLEQAIKAAEDMKATTGIYDASLGQRSNEKSGVAIRERRAESDAANSIYTDNMRRGIEVTGQILVDMIPRVYDTNRVVQVIDVEDNTKQVEINGIAETQHGPVAINPLDHGKYAVRITVGPNYATKRQEAADSMIEFARAFPNAVPVIADLIAENMDWPGANQFAERLKALLPPGVGGDDDPEAQAQQQAQMQAQQQQQAQVQEIAMRKAVAETVEAEADAEKAQAEAMEKRLELAISSGQLDVAFQDAIARALGSAMQTGFIPQ